MSSIPYPLFEQRWPDGEFRLVQLGFVVDDVVDSASRWADLFGVGPFVVLPRIDVPCTYRGAPSGVEMQVAYAQAGPVQIELIAQSCDRPSVFRDIAACGTAFHQLCTLTAHYDEKKEYYASAGLELVSEIVIPGQRVAYFGTYEEFGFVTEVAEQSDEFLERLDDMARTCAAWDGRDPVRILTRDGYRVP